MRNGKKMIAPASGGQLTGTFDGVKANAVQSTLARCVKREHPINESTPARNVLDETNVAWKQLDMYEMIMIRLCLPMKLQPPRHSLGRRKLM